MLQPNASEDLEAGETVNNFASKADTFDFLKFNSDSPKVLPTDLLPKRLVQTSFSNLDGKEKVSNMLAF